MAKLGPKTIENLNEALAGESIARNKYEYFASVARKAGFVQLSNIFKESADNEKEHAKLWAKALGLIGDSATNIQAAISAESYENQIMYPKMAEEAEAEGHTELAESFRRVAEAEKAHEARFRQLLINLENDQVFKKERVVRWKCNNCGYIAEGLEAPTECPACAHPQAHFEVFVETY